MANIQLKIVDEGLQADKSSFVDQLKDALASEDIHISDNAELSLKVKFIIDDGHEKVALILRDALTKQKISEEVILYFADKWINKACREAVDMVHNTMHPEELH